MIRLLFNAKRQLNVAIEYTENLNTALRNADFTVIITDWPDVLGIDLSVFAATMKTSVVFENRNYYSLDKVRQSEVEYDSIGRPSHIPELTK